MDYRNDTGFRKQRLIGLLNAVTRYEPEIFEALNKDFGKSAFESYISETSIVAAELKRHIRNIRRWSKPERILPWLPNFPTSDTIHREPYGSVLIIAPWNYPFQLAMLPLISAVAAGNSVTLKPSELTPHTANLIAEIVRSVFDPNHVEVYIGGPEVSQRLLTHRWDYIFFTGSVQVGKIVARAAAENLTPATLELGGKNPCIIDKTADLNVAARRICWGKFFNAGQTCIAPDYLLVHKDVKEKLVSLLIDEIRAAYGNDPRLSPDYPRIINKKNHCRLNALLDGQTLLWGGSSDVAERYLSPTLIDNPAPESMVMQEEIFGPILPVIAFESEDDVAKTIGRFEKPLSLYVFSQNKAFSKRMVSRFSFGGGCINDTMIHFSNARLPFGGVGHSGMGAYHGRRGFDTFSHLKAVVRKSTSIDIPLRYAPYTSKKFALIRNILRWF